MYDDRFAEGLIAGQNGSNRNDNGFGDNSWWVIIIFALLFGWGGNGTGFGNRGNGGGSGSMDLGYDIGKLATSNDVASGFASSASLGRLNDLMLGQAGIQQSLCQGFNGTNTALLQGFNGVERSMCNIGFQLENCCCQTQRAIDGVNYNMAKNTCDLQNTMNNNTRDINPEEFGECVLEMTVNMLYSDYCKVLKYGIERVEPYIELAYALLKDEDLHGSPEEKFSLYYRYIVEK